MPNLSTQNPPKSGLAKPAGTEGVPANHLPPGRIDSIEELESCLSGAQAFRVQNKRPFITVSYAQSLDGSIATRRRQPIGLSGPAALTLTHQIRACCDAILIGIGTLLADDPRLSVRLVEGSSPQPIILDTHLRTPLSAKLVQRSDAPPWIVNGGNNPRQLAQALQAAGSRLITCDTAQDGRIDLHALMTILHGMQVNSIMVEGGARVITSLLNSRLVDQFIVTVSPKLVGGLPVIDSAGLKPATNLELVEVSYRNLGQDLIIWGRPAWPT
jgi:3,4-dihydroxy 2-butanone 4-phosphate synthase/GTP cyclohydrolase II